MSYEYVTDSSFPSKKWLIRHDIALLFLTQYVSYVCVLVLYLPVWNLKFLLRFLNFVFLCLSTPV